MSLDFKLKKVLPKISLHKKIEEYALEEIVVIDNVNHHLHNKRATITFREGEIYWFVTEDKTGWIIGSTSAINLKKLKPKENSDVLETKKFMENKNV